MDGIIKQIADHQALGARQVGLGIQQMPNGYAIMLNADESHYYWLRHDGATSEVHWNKWRIYHGAVLNAEATAAMSDIRSALK
jgi:hypothetical protein